MSYCVFTHAPSCPQVELVMVLIDLGVGCDVVEIRDP